MERETVEKGLFRLYKRSHSNGTIDFGLDGLFFKCNPYTDCCVPDVPCKIIEQVEESGQFVIPAEAGIQVWVFWTPASAGVTYLGDTTL